MMLTSTIFAACRLVTRTRGLQPWTRCLDAQVAVRFKSRATTSACGTSMKGGHSSGAGKARKDPTTSDTVTIYDVAYIPGQGRTSKIVLGLFGLFAVGMTFLCGFERIILAEDKNEEEEKTKASKKANIPSADSRRNVAVAQQEKKPERQVDTTGKQSLANTSDSCEVSNRPPKALLHFFESNARETVATVQNKKQEDEEETFSIVDVLPTSDDIFPAFRRGMHFDCSFLVVAISIAYVVFLFTRSRRVKSLKYCHETKQLLLTRHTALGGLSRAHAVNAGQLVELVSSDRAVRSARTRVLYILDSWSFFAVTPVEGITFDERNFDKLLPKRPREIATVRSLLKNWMRQRKHT